MTAGVWREVFAASDQRDWEGICSAGAGEDTDDMLDPLRSLEPTSGRKSSASKRDASNPRLPLVSGALERAGDELGEMLGVDEGACASLLGIIGLLGFHLRLRERDLPVAMSAGPSARFLWKSRDNCRRRGSQCRRSTPGRPVCGSRGNTVTGRVSRLGGRPRHTDGTPPRDRLCRSSIPGWASYAATVRGCLTSSGTV